MAFKRALSPEEKIPKKKESTAPESLKQSSSRPRSTGPRHDSLCIEVYQESHALLLVDKQRGKTLLDQSPEDIPKLSRCYCNCAACWLPTGRTRTKTKTNQEAGRQTGRCICRSCPCWTTRLNSTPFTPSTKDTSSLKKS